MVHVTHHKDNSISFRSSSLDEMNSISEHYSHMYPIKYLKKYSQFYIRLNP